MAGKITSIIEEYLESFLKEEGYELYHVDYFKEGKDWYLKVYIDTKKKDDYVSLEDCEKVSRFLSEKLDENDPIDKNYFLEVSSPGLDRQLFTEEHFKRYLGNLVDVKLYKGFEGKKLIQGELISKTDEELMLKEIPPVTKKKSKSKKQDSEEKKEKIITLPMEIVAKVQLAVVI